MQAADAVYCRVGYPMDHPAGRATAAFVVRRPAMSGMTEERRRP